MSNTFDTLNSLPGGLLVRPPTMDDAQAITEVIVACDIDEYGEPDFTEQDLRSIWQTPGYDMATDSWVVIAPEGQIVGFATVSDNEHVRMYMYGAVHPAYRGRGIGTRLMRLAETRARQHISLAHPDARVTLQNWLSGVNTDAQCLLEQQGFTDIRHHWRMEIEMLEPPPTPVWPEDITIRTIVPGQDDRAVFEMIDEAFQDHWGHMPGNFEKWQNWTVKRKDFDPSLYFLACDGDELAGSALCKYQLNIGWVDDLGVRRPWRRHGLGLALLHHAFGEFYRRGTYKVGLGVDSQNLTGATRLYERAGMHIARQYIGYEKELRTGVELSTQAIEE